MARIAKAAAVILTLFGVIMPSQAVNPFVDGNGTIEVLQHCSPGVASWSSLTQFKLSDGQWFGLWTQNSTAGLDSDAEYALVMLAYTTKEPITVRASWSATGDPYTACGIAAYMVYRTQGEYIRLGTGTVP